ncbi:TonB-dependent receptor family protein [Pseudoduganella namucuonensis]|uniref:Iron complex outermembrane recepter protein n=1 Tax=Pseudoduganella namucuonensis TaxID=1035707 RepID=A0A1I7M6W4_9BURK|nr:TonB-dependent receptor [Pseudoduganella namucuonensis]SFV17673.1 iron complex outermembrane recepter protein [Pseudoduganella namucuonensis]
MQHRFRLNTIAALFAGTAALAPPSHAADAVVIVSGARVEHSGFDFPAAIDVIDAARIRDSQMRVNASEALSAVPGLVAQNRQNYAQDLQISSRGFGARSAFGVRGVKLIADGIPASMPDGQGQAATFNLDMAERIEVLRGPFSAVYGNHSGGVVQLFTRDGAGAPTIETSVSGGSDGALKVDVNAQGKSGGVGYVLDASRFDTDGYRDHSAARRDQAYAKLTVAPAAGAKLTITASALRQKDTQDPLGATWATFQRDPRAGETDATDPATPKRTFADRYNTRKSIDHQQAGGAWEQRFGDGTLRVSAYGGNRQVIQYQAFSRAFQAPPSHSGGVVDFDREFHGADVSWVDARALAGGKLTSTAGIEYGRSSDDRQGYENFVGTELGVKGRLRRDEENVVSSTDPYLQTEWQGGSWLLNAGLRHSRFKVDVSDRFLANGNDSGAIAYSRTTPVAGVLYKLTPVLNVYASAARGFETPTLNELFYSGAGGGFNFRLQPARSTHLEAGVKSMLGSRTRIDAALFQVKTSDELVVDAASGGRTSYRNASKTLRRGAEVSVESAWDHGLSGKLALTALRATYDQAFGSVLKGSRLPGVPNANLYGELAWKDASERLGAALETIASARVYAEDSNVEKAAPGYAIVNARVTAKQDFGGWRFKQFARVNNLLDRAYVGSVIVGDTNKRYYEAAPGRNWQLGASAQYRF